MLTPRRSSSVDIRLQPYSVLGLLRTWLLRGIALPTTSDTSSIDSKRQLPMREIIGEILRGLKALCALIPDRSVSYCQLHRTQSLYAEFGTDRTLLCTPNGLHLQGYVHFIAHFTDLSWRLAAHTVRSNTFSTDHEQPTACMSLLRPPGLHFKSKTWNVKSLRSS
jgi:hypothetical protein